MELLAAAASLVTALERRRATGTPLPAALVELAALLVQSADALESQGRAPTWAAAQARIERAVARRRAAALDILRAQAPLRQPKREIAEPEQPSEALSVTLFDLLRTFEQILEKTRQNPVPRSLE